MGRSVALDRRPPVLTFVNLSRRSLPPLTDDRAGQIAWALRGNTTVTGLRLPVHHLTLAGTRGMAHFISSCPSLRWLEITDGFSHRNHNQDFELLEAIVDQFLIAAGINGEIEHLEIINWFGAHAFASCMRGLQDSLSALVIGDAEGFTAGDDVQEAIDEAEMVGRAVHGLRSLRRLNIVHGMYFLVPFLNHFNGEHPNIQVLSFAVTRTNETAELSQPVRNILAASPRLVEFGFYVYQIEDEPMGEDLATVFRALEQHPSLEILKMHFDNRAERIVNLLRLNTSLDEIETVCHSVFVLCDILEALTINTTLYRLSVTVQTLPERDWLEGHRRLGALIPRMKDLKSLHFDTNGTQLTMSREASSYLLRGFELNTSLTSVSVEWLRDVDGGNAGSSIEYYATRNRFGPALAEASKPEMLTIMKGMMETHGEPERGLSVIFETLRARDGWYDEI